MIKVQQAVIVEGKYDKIRLENIIDAPIITTNGFSIFKDKQKMAYIRKLAEKRGIIILTDSDSAGFLIRSHIGGSLPKDRVKHVYIPDIFGKEKRKAHASAEGKLGVEGISDAVLIKAFEKAGVTGVQQTDEKTHGISKADLFEAGVYGREGSAALRARLLKDLDLPENLSVNGMLKALNIFMTYDAFIDCVQNLKSGRDGVGRTTANLK